MLFFTDSFPPTIRTLEVGRSPQEDGEGFPVGGGGVGPGGGGGGAA